MDVLKLIEKPKDKKFIDMQDKDFNYWHVLYYGGKWGKKQKSHFWYCKCICGKHKLLTGNSLRMGTTKSCGCQFNKKQDLIGKRFGRWLVIGEALKNKTGRICWLCLCDCGIEKVITAEVLNKGESKSCGCLKKELSYHRYLENLEGVEFGRLKVIRLSDFERVAKWLCECKCGKEVIVLARSLKSGHTKSCGCLSIEKSTDRVMKVNKLRGKFHHCYNPLISDEDRIKKRFAYGPEIKKWRMDVFERDEFTCKCCDTKGALLNAHHLNGYHWCKEERFEINNGITLCVECHKKFHSKYGRKNNTKEQFKLFLDSIKSPN